MMTSFNSSQFIAIVTACTLGFTAFSASKYYSEGKTTSGEQKEKILTALVNANGLLQRAHPLQALALLNENRSFIDLYPDLKKEWQGLVFKSAEDLKDGHLLISLFKNDPLLFQHSEEASLILASFALANADLETYHNIAKIWAIKENAPEWVLLKADELALKNEPENAKELLVSYTFQKDAEIARLTRLALLNENEHPKIAWEYLLKALKINPHFSDLHLYRAELLESTNYPEMALLEYKEAAFKSPLDPFYKEELVDYYLRKNKLKEAFIVLQNALGTKTSDKLWLKAVFFHKVYQPSKQNLADGLNLGPKASFIRYLLAIAPTEFWSEALLSSQPSVEQIAAKIPESAWLKVFDKLKIGEDAKAFEILEENPEMASLNPALYAGLKKAIQIHHPYLKKEQAVYVNESNSHPIFSMLMQENPPEDYAALFASKESYTALLIASGWFEAALQLELWYPNKTSNYTAIPREFPRWYTYGLAKALVSNRSPEEALTFIKEQHPTPQLSLLLSELNIQQKHFADAEKNLLPLAKTTSPIGLKAALLLSNLYRDQGAFIKAKSSVLDNPELANSLAGKEALARLELLFGDQKTAEKMYSAITDSSIEAKSFFAKKAFQAGDYKKAYLLTKQLSEQYPEHAGIKSQLSEIAQVSASAKM